MRKEFMLEMDAEQLDRYAAVLGIDTTAAKTVKGKANIIERRRERTARIPVLGIEIEVPIKRLHDQRYNDRINTLSRGVGGDEEMYALMAELIGQEQVDAIKERATDEDGTVDVDALGFAFSEIVTSDELKNF